MHDGWSLMESLSWRKGSLNSCENEMELPSHANEVPEQKSFDDDKIPWVAYRHIKLLILLCAFSKHHQRTLVILPSRKIPAKLWSMPPSSDDLSRAWCSCRARCRPWIESLPACQKAFAGLPWWCTTILSSVWDFCSHAAIFVIFFSPAISPRQKFDKGLHKAMVHKSYRPRNVREELK